MIINNYIKRNKLIKTWFALVIGLIVIGTPIGFYLGLAKGLEQSFSESVLESTLFFLAIIFIISFSIKFIEKIEFNENKKVMKLNVFNLLGRDKKFVVSYGELSFIEGHDYKGENLMLYSNQKKIIKVRKNDFKKENFLIFRNKLNEIG